MGFAHGPIFKFKSVYIFVSELSDCFLSFFKVSMLKILNFEDL